ncbi:GDSL esterase lipase At4g28780-like [Olea europaea subsp. europaea]|uniref:GDSL esterase lipase At4g28780-like n=1 Tax=Olea europaea subsp. europaea TaxID=158383 RepID=A0A8S0QBK0_OLEEU|nr:GDSL esterase lipase At4g28780-like [Olea europaea subsp. europaea]
MSIPNSYAILAAVSLAAIIMSRAVPPIEASRAFFIFGDSLVDIGNNNYLATAARADSPPYGIDFPTHRPTGRFSNGYSIPDIISQKLGAELTLPYLSPELKGQKLLVGANFASAGVGILGDTGFQFVNIIRIHEQFLLFKQYQGRVSALIGEEQAEKLVNKALVLITLGGNDFVNNYFWTPITARSLEFSLHNFSTYLISEYKNILLSLHQLGFRQILVTGIGPIGCAPVMLATRSINGKCAEEPNLVMKIFNPLLRQMLKDLNHELGSAVFISINSLEMQSDVIYHPRAHGFITSKVACCGQGPYNGLGLCTAASCICSNRDLYVFWDPFHPTERVNRIIVDAMFNGSEKYMSPMNLSTIMAMDSMT